MDRSSILLTFATLFLFTVYTSFLLHPYLIQHQIIFSNFVALASAILFYLAYMQRGKEIKFKWNVNINLIAAITLFFLLIIYSSNGDAVIISIAGVFAFGYFSKKLSSHMLYAFLIAGIIITAACAFIFLISVWTPSFKGVDEIAYSYYASYFLLHGLDPYKMNMAPSLAQYGTNPTVQLNGSIEGAYNYPALSLIPTTILSLLGLYAYINIIPLVALISVGICFFVYYKSNYNTSVLMPLAIWLFATYTVVPTVDHYISVGVFMLLAYVLRKKTNVYGLLMGLAASMIQLAWFAIPFFLILTLREDGKEKAFRALLITIVVFVLVNAYFIIQGPRVFLTDVFGIFKSSKLLPIGPDISQFFLRDYGVALWLPSAITVISFAALLLLFYLYTDTLKPLIAIAPAFIFFLSFRNLEYYGLPFVPLLILICYMKEKKGPKDILKNKLYIPATFAAVAIISIILAIYAHAAYTNQNTLVVTYISPSIMNASGMYNIKGIRINITNNGNNYENVSFLYFANKPNVGNFILTPNTPSIAPHYYLNYTLNASMINVTNNTRLYIFAFSKDYLTWNSEYQNKTSKSGN